MGALIAGCQVPRKFEERGKLWLMGSSGGKHYLFIEEYPHRLSGGCYQGAMDASNPRLNMLARGELRRIGAYHTLMSTASTSEKKMPQ